jgi:acetate kinase
VGRAANDRLYLVVVTHNEIAIESRAHPRKRMTDAIIALNAGSSSLKFAIFAIRDGGELQPRVRGAIDSLDGAPQFTAKAPDGSTMAEHQWERDAHPKYDDLLRYLISWSEDHLGSGLLAAGHRVVHGGANYAEPVIVTDHVLADLAALTPLVPLHQPHNLAPIEALHRTHAHLPQVVCFDTAFHRTQPQVARLFGLPRALADAGVVRYGFHGLSYEYIAGMLAAYDARAAAGRTIVAHLGNGASLCALVGGLSVATTMGLGVLDGLLMGTRCGSLDPGVVLYLIREKNLSADAIEQLLERESGLLGVSGISHDMRTLLESRVPAARDAVDLFVYRAVCAVGAMAAAAGGIDALVFTAGIGEHSPEVRSAICSGLNSLGISLDQKANRESHVRISGAQSATSVLVIPTDEELVIARHTVEVISAKPTR